MKSSSRVIMVAWLAACFSTGAFAMPPPTSSDLMVDVPITVNPSTAQSAALKAYVLGRYRRVKATLAQDRRTARSYMSEKMEQRYRANFHPETALAQFEQCSDCEEFAIDIGAMHTVAATMGDGSRANLTHVKARTKPLKATAPVAMDIEVLWKPAQAQGIVIRVEDDQAHTAASQIPQGEDDAGADPVHDVPRTNKTR